VADELLAYARTRNVNAARHRPPVNGRGSPAGEHGPTAGNAGPSTNRAADRTAPTASTSTSDQTSEAQRARAIVLARTAAYLQRHAPASGAGRACRRRWRSSPPYGRWRGSLRAILSTATR